jgi:hypothetical protein
MANEIIRPSALETERTSPVASEFLVTDDGTTVAKVKLDKAVQAGRPAASKNEAEAGSDANKVMTPLTVQQKIDYEIGKSLASKAQGDKADTAIQPNDLGAVATSNDYDDLDNKPTLGTAAAEDVEAFATATQGGKADTAWQPTTVLPSPSLGDWDGATAYQVNDRVFHNGNYWIAKADNTNSEPEEGVDWTLFLPGVAVADGSVTDAKIANPSRLYNRIQHLPNLYDWDGGDFTDRLKNALADKPSDLLIPGTGDSENPHLLEDTVIIPGGTTIRGMGTYDIWEDSESPFNAGRPGWDGRGTVIKTSGPGTGARWTDIGDPDDDPLFADNMNFKPMFVYGGNGIWMKNLSLVTDQANPWSAAIFAPSVRQCGTEDIYAYRHWTDAAIYLDATWSSRNTMLMELHPEVVPSLGMNEFTNIRGLFRGLRGLRIQGSRRDPSLYPGASMLWAPAGTSDITSYATRFAGDNQVPGYDTIGASFWSDHRVGNTGGVGQGHNFVACYFRTAGKYNVWLDHSGRDHFQGCYGETTNNLAGYVGFRIGLGTVNCFRDMDSISGGVEFDGNVYPSSSTLISLYTGGRMITQRSDGRIWTPNLDMPAVTGSSPKITSYHSAGEIELCNGDGATGLTRLTYLTLRGGAAYTEYESPSQQRISATGAVTAGADVLRISGGSLNAVVYDRGTGSAGFNSANAVFKVSTMQTTGRSINAGGTINASGADYAEYHQVKEHLYGSVAKGAILGYAADGLLTDRFADVVGRFVIKSTNPYGVGGDDWGSEDKLIAKYGIEPIGDEPVLKLPEPPETEDDEAALAEYQKQVEAARADHELAMQSHQQRVAAMMEAYEIERAKWDRIAKSGYVPVNITATAADIGKYLVPIDDGNGGITAALMSEDEMSLKQYIRSIGCVLGVSSDGRPLVEVKVG